MNNLPRIVIPLCITVSLLLLLLCACVHRVLEDQLHAENRQLTAAYSDAVAAVRQMLDDSREMHTLLLHTHTYVVSASCWQFSPCHIYTVPLKEYPQRFSGNISPTTDNFKLKFYMLIVCSYQRKITKFYLVIIYFDKVILY